MDFYSLLFPAEDRMTRAHTVPPEAFRDLKLDQVVESIVSGKDEYNLKPFFYTPVQDMGTISDRQEILMDLENENVLTSIRAFAKGMRRLRNFLSLEQNSSSSEEAQGWFVEAAELYCTTVQTLLNDLSVCECQSQGLSAVVQYLNNLIGSSEFRALSSENKQVRTLLSEVQYCVLIKGQSITVQKCESHTDYSTEVQGAFERFQRGSSKDYRVDFSDWVQMNHIDAQILHLVSKLFPDVFDELNRFYREHQGFIDEAVLTFDREIQFYIAYYEYIAPLKGQGLHFCYPKVSDESKEIYAYDTFDIALAQNLMTSNQQIVCNDFYLRGEERILVVSGPNQGGKTTFARTFGQLHFLACLGLSVPGRDASTFVFDNVFTHFEREEHARALNGKLKDDLLRIRQILDQSTSKSIIILNEIFSSTALMDAIFLGEKVLGEVIQLDALCVIVTFIDELASFNDATVSFVSKVSPENPDIRTYKITRQKADGRAYAISIARKYGLTYDQLKERLTV